MKEFIKMLFQGGAIYAVLLGIYWSAYYLNKI